RRETSQDPISEPEARERENFLPGIFAACDRSRELGRLRLGLLDRVRLSAGVISLREREQSFIALVQRVHFGLGQVLDIDEPVTWTLQDCDDLVQLEVNRPGILVLRTLDEEDHEERDDRGAGVDDELPGIREVK